MNNIPLLQTQNLWKIYEETGDRLEILRGIDFSLSEGETVAIMGASGAGKSTLLNLLGALDQSTSGQILFRGQDIAAYKEKERDRYRSENLGFIFQFHHLLPEFTAIENVMVPGRILGKTAEECREDAENLLAAVGLEQRAKHLPAELSGGERQRVAVARALMNKPALVLADEPSGNLDEQNSDRLNKLFLDLNQSLGQTFLIVTHDRRLASLASRCVQMHSGQISLQ